MIDFLFLSTCYNRPSKTLRSIDNIISQMDNTKHSFKLIIVDCSDEDKRLNLDTNKSAKVEIIRGCSDLFWASGMIYGYEKIKDHYKFNYLIAFNDDIELYDKSILKAYEEIKQINYPRIIYSICFKNSKGISSYGGRIRGRYKLQFNNLAPNQITPVEVDVVNMNFTFISNQVIEKVGFLDTNFEHGLADFDLALQNKNYCGKNYISSFYGGNCELNPLKGTSKDCSLGFLKRLQRLNSVKEQPFKQRYYFFRKHLTLIETIFTFPIAYISLLIRSIFKSQ